MKHSYVGFRPLPSWLGVITDALGVITTNTYKFPSPLEVTGGYYLFHYKRESLQYRLVSVPSRGEWGVLRNSDTHKIFLKTMFPYPFEVTKISYLVIPDEPKKPELFPPPPEETGGLTNYHFN